MNPRSAVRRPPGLAVLLLRVTVVHAGGWDIVTLKDFPDFVVAGEPLNLTFKVWVPSLDPLADLQPAIRATSCPGLCAAGLAPQPRYAKTKELVVKAKTGAAPGEYTASLILLEPGDWFITVDTDYPGAPTLPLLKVVAPGTPPPAPFSPAIRGSRLFITKGCNACHLRDEAGRVYGPDLTGRRFAPEYLKKFLADPS